MRKRERERLRQSIARGAERAVYGHLIEDAWPMMWEGIAKEWDCPEVAEECRAVYERVCKALGVKARKG